MELLKTKLNRANGQFAKIGHMGGKQKPKDNILCNF